MLDCPVLCGSIKATELNLLVTNSHGYRGVQFTKHGTLIIPTCYSLLMSTFNNAHRGDDSKGGWKASFSRASRKRLRRTRVAEKRRPHPSVNNSSLRPAPPSLLSGCHGSSRGGEQGSIQGCKWESTRLQFASFLRSCPPSFLLPSLFQLHLGQSEGPSFVFLSGLLLFSFVGMHIFHILNIYLFSLWFVSAGGEKSPGEKSLWVWAVFKVFKACRCSQWLNIVPLK